MKNPKTKGPKSTVPRAAALGSSTTEFQILYPGESVPCAQPVPRRFADDAERAEEFKLNDQFASISIEVRPIGFTHLQRFTGEIMGAISHIGAVNPLKADGSKKAEGDIAKEALIAIGPYLALKLMALVNECCTVEGLPRTKEVPTLTDALRRGFNPPHWLMPRVIDSWFHQSFDEEDKYLPWMAVADKVLAKLTGGTVSLSEVFSNVFPAPGTVSEASSTTDNPDSPTEDGLTPSSSTGVESPVP